VRYTYQQSEAVFMATVRQAAAVFGWKVLHIYDSRRSSGGFPDLLMVRRDRLVAAELKSATGRVRPEQTDWLNALKAAGVETHVWRPGDWPEVEEVLR
jgi:VRR-NUC domain-containing protein